MIGTAGNGEEVPRMRPIICACIGTLSLAGCAGVEVRDDNSNHGIPFYVKVPVLTQETQRVRTDLTVRFKVVETSNGKSRSIDLPASGPLPVPGVTRADIDKALDQIPDTATYVQAIAHVKTGIIQALEALSEKKQAAIASAASSDPCKDTDLPVVSNSWSVAMVADTKLHYIVTKQPLFGSSTANFEFAQDGTMTKSNVTVTDDTAKTLLAVLPISPLLSKRWNLASKSPNSTNLDLRFPDTTSPKPQATAVQTEIRVEVTLAADTSIITLRKVSPFSDSALKSHEPLSYCNALTANTEIQLISIARPDAAKKSDKGADKGWQIQGTVMPPKTADAAPAGDK
jgi:hypothetical protein